MNEYDNTSAGTAQDESGFLLRVKQEMDRSCAALDGSTQSRLNAMRHAALAQGQRKWLLLGLRKPQLLPFGGLVTACVLVIAVLLQPPGSAILPEPTQVEDLDLLTATEELDFYEEYEFYQWLATSDAGY